MVRFLIHRKNSTKIFIKAYIGFLISYKVIISKAICLFKRVKWNSALNKDVLGNVYSYVYIIYRYTFYFINAIDYIRFAPKSVTSIWIMIIIMTRSIYLFSTRRINHWRCIWCVKIYNLEVEERGAYKETREKRGFGRRKWNWQLIFIFGIWTNLGSPWRKKRVSKRYQDPLKKATTNRNTVADESQRRWIYFLFFIYIITALMSTDAPLY